MSSFETKNIAECCEILNNKRAPLNSEQRDDIKGAYPYYGANGVQGYIDKYMLDDDLILLAEDGGYFDEYSTRPIAYRVKGKCWVNNHAHILKAREGYSQDFIFQSLVHKNIIQFIKGGTRSKLNLSELKQIEIHTPSLPFQRKIACILSTIDGQMEKTEAIIAKYQAVKQGMLQDLFTRGIDVRTGQLRPRYKDAPDLYQESALGMIPKEWEVVQIKHHVESSAFGPRFPGEAYSSKGNIATLRTTDINEEGIIDYKGMPMALLDYKAFEKHILKKDDLLITRSGTVGIASVFDEFAFPVLPGAFLIRFRFKTTVNTAYLKEYFTDKKGKKQLLDIAEGGVQKNIRGSAVLSLMIPLPTIMEQIRTNLTIESVSRRILLSNHELDKLRLLKQGMMQDLLSGKVEVTA